MRDKLIKLLKEIAIDYNDVDYYAEKIADYLLENGVIVPPCKVGTKVFALLGRKDSVTETFVEKIVLDSNNTVRLKLAANAMYETSVKSIGKTVFFFEEAAEKALKGGEQK